MKQVSRFYMIMLSVMTMILSTAWASAQVDPPTEVLYSTGSTPFDLWMPDTSTVTSSIETLSMEVFQIDTSLHVGKIPVIESVSQSGARVYSLPITAVSDSPFVPQLSLVYNSQASEGLAGYGWNLAGLSSITAIPKNEFYHDVFQSVNLQDTSTVFALDGIPLLLNTKTSLADEYDLETVQGHVVVKKHTTDGLAAYFTVLYPNGSRAVFGFRNFTANQHTFPLTEIVDINGNVINYEYEQCGSQSGNLFIPSSIKFGHREAGEPTSEIVLEYDHTIPLPVDRYSAGVKKGHHYLLKSVICKNNGIEVMRYNLTHIEDNHAYFLKRIDCSSLGSQINPVLFTYEFEGMPDVTPEFNRGTGITLTEYFNTDRDEIHLIRGKFALNDYDDGLLMYPDKSPYDIIESKNNKYYKFGSKYSPTDKVILVSQIDNPHFEYSFEVGENFMGLVVADADGDGTDEVIKINLNQVGENSTVFRLRRYGSNRSGNSFHSQKTHDISFPVSIYDSKLGYSPVCPNFYVGDFLGNGKQQLLIVTDQSVYSGASIKSWACLVDLDKMSLLKRFEYTKYSTNYKHEYFAADIDQDGICELCHVSSGMMLYAHQFNGEKLDNDRFYRYNSSLASITPESGREGPKSFITDFNGDGYLDVVSAPVESYNYEVVIESDLPDEDDYVTTHYKDNGDEWTVYCFTGEEFVARTMNVCNFDRGDEYMFMDVNKDGLSDLIRRKEHHTLVYLNDYGTLSPNGIETPFPVKETAHLVPCTVADYSEVSDFMIVDSQSVGLMTFSRDVSKERLLTAFTDSYGLTTYNGYINTVSGGAGIDDSREYDSDNSFMRKLIPFNVLHTSMTYSGPDKQSSQSIQQHMYAYYDPVVHGGGLGFMGFGKTWTKDMIAGIETVNSYAPEYFGAMISSATSLSSSEGSPFQVVESSYFIPEGIAMGKFNPRMSFTSQTDSLSGNKIMSKYTYDGYGNPMKVSTRYCNVADSIYFHDEVASYTYKYNLDSEKYILGLPSVETIVNHSSDTSKTVLGKRVSYEYDEATLRLVRLKRYTTSGTGFVQFNSDFDNDGNLRSIPFLPIDFRIYLESDTKYTYDVYGNVLSEKTASYGSETYLGNEYTYDEAGRRVVSETDPLGRMTTYSDFNIFGRPCQVTDYKGHSTLIEYDEWGVVSKKALPDGKIEKTRTTWGGPGLYTVTTTATGTPSAKVHYDILGREVRTEQLRFDGTWMKADKEYDSKGRISRESQPYKSTSPVHWTVHEYDSYGRPVSSTSTSGGSLSWTYDGNTVVERKAGTGKRVTKDAKGNVVSVADPGTTITYDYRTDGQPTSVRAFGRNVASFEYDEYGRRISLTDISAGEHKDTIVYNPDGSSVRTQILPNGVIVSEYDLYGRLTGVDRQGEYTTTYNYSQYGHLVSEISTNGTAKYYTYDDFDRLSQIREVIPDGYMLRSECAYGPASVLSSVSYYTKNGVVCTENYGYSNGECTTVTVGDNVIFNLMSENSMGLPTRVQTLGIRRDYSYDSSGRPALRRSFSTSQGDVQIHTYEFDNATSNLHTRTDVLRNLEDEFSYDVLNRLTIENGRERTYDASGNILQINGSGLYTYSNPSKPFQMLTGLMQFEENYTSGQNISYTCYGRPSRLNENGYSASFTYNADGDRVKMSVAKGAAMQQVNYYIGDRYELERKPGSDVERFYLGGDYYSAPVVLVRQNAGDWVPYNILRDYLGSVTGITQADGTLVAEYNYDAWGRLRDPETHLCYEPGQEPDLFIGRGYTGHEHLPWFNLINMNARLYDPLIGRFISPDPFVQAPDFSQSFNRYTYCLNNPLVYVDENGEFWHIVIGSVIGGISNWVANGCEFTWQGLGYFGVGASIGAISAITGALMPSVIQVSGVFAGAAKGATYGMMTGGVSNILLNGVNNMLQGNNFFVNCRDAMVNGAISGAISGAFAGGWIGGINALESGKNVWWGCEVKYGRTQWSFITSEKPYEVVRFNNLHDFSTHNNDCLPNTCAEINAHFSGNRGYDSWAKRLMYVEDEGVYASQGEVKKFFEAAFNTSEFNINDITNIELMKKVAENNELVTLFMEYQNQYHMDNIRYVKYYSNKIKVGIRIRDFLFQHLSESTLWSKLVSGLRY